jgi:hypothetical protein
MVADGRYERIFCFFEPRIERFVERQRRTRKALTAALLLILIAIIWAVLQARYGW